MLGWFQKKAPAPRSPEEEPRSLEEEAVERIASLSIERWRSFYADGKGGWELMAADGARIHIERDERREMNSADETMYMGRKYCLYVDGKTVSILFSDFAPGGLSRYQFERGLGEGKESFSTRNKASEMLKALVQRLDSSPATRWTRTPEELEERRAAEERAEAERRQRENDDLLGKIR